MVWVDFGGVLSPPIETLFSSYERRTGVPSPLLKRAMGDVADEMEVATLAPVELGLVTEREWVNQLKSRLETYDPSLDLTRIEPDFGKQWFDGHLVDPTMRRMVIDLKKMGVRVGILTNNVREWEPYWRRMVDLDDIVDDIVDSYQVGYRKPDPEIFRLAATRNDTLPRNCVLIDDLSENCAAATRAGWTAIEHLDAQSSSEQVLDILNRRLY